MLLFYLNTSTAKVVVWTEQKPYSVIVFVLFANVR